MGEEWKALVRVTVENAVRESMLGEVAVKVSVSEESSGREEVIRKFEEP